MLITTYSCHAHTLGVAPLQLQINISRGIKFHLLGIPARPGNEIRNRVYTALRSNGWRWPGQRITIQCEESPVPVRHYELDLAIALGILAASNQLHLPDLDQYLIVGNLGLDGTLLKTKDPYNAVARAIALGKKGIILQFDADFSFIAPLPNGFRIGRAVHIQDAIDILQAEHWQQMPITSEQLQITQQDALCFSQVEGHEIFKRAMEVAAAGGHHLWAEGSPGLGKTMLLERMHTILPPPNVRTVALVQSLGEAFGKRTVERPCGSLRLEQSLTSIYGNAPELMQYAIEAFNTGAQDLSDVPVHAIPGKPQQVPTLIKSLGGVLIVDELLKHKERFRAALLKPMDSYAFQCIAAANPCPCGHFNSPIPCKCTPIALENHRQRFQAALRDRFDICLPITAPRQEFEAAETSTQIQRRVHQAWSIQMSRQGKQNAQLSEEEILFLGLVPQNIYQWLVEHCVESRISIRGRRQVLGVALTIMDLAEQPRMDLGHLQEALLMRD